MTIKGVGGDDNEIVDIGIMEDNRKNMAKFQDFVKARAGFFNFRARLAFNKWMQTFIKALILYHIDSECHM